MKNFSLLLIALLACFYIKAQSEQFVVPISNLTKKMITKNYSLEDQKELNQHPQKLKSLDYIYSKSFQVQTLNYTEEQFQKIDITKYDLSRKVSENVLVYDEASGLQLILDPLNKMEEEKNALLYPNTKINNPTNKIANP